MASGTFPVLNLPELLSSPKRRKRQNMDRILHSPDSEDLARELPHRQQPALEVVARNLTILLWSDFSELVCGPGWNSESTAVKQELERRILKSAAAAGQ